jgi:hypothetical protein
MNWDAIGAVGEILGAIGVIASLAYLSVQIRRSDLTSRAQSLQSVLDGHRDRSFLVGYTDPNYADLISRGMTDFELLSANEKRQFYMWVQEQCFQLQQAMELHELGLLPKIDFEAWLFYAATVVQTPGGSDVWPYIEETITPTIKGLINKYVSENPDTPSFIEINPLFRHVGDDET